MMKKMKMVIKITKSILKISNPKSTPIKLSKTETDMIMGVDAELNCATRMRKMSKTAMSKARPRSSELDFSAPAEASRVWSSYSYRSLLIYR